MRHSPAIDSDSSHDDTSSFSFPPVFLLLSMLSSLVAWLALYLPWLADGELNGMGTPVGTYTFNWAGSGWSFATSVLLILNVICSLLWLRRVTRLASLLIWGVVKVPATIGIIFFVTLSLAHNPAVAGPWVYTCALVGMVLCDLLVRRHYRLAEILTIPHGEETFRPPY